MDLARWAWLGPFRKLGFDEAGKVHLDAYGGWFLTLEGHNDISRSSSAVRITGMAFGKSEVNPSVQTLLLRPATCRRDLR
jgi:hypothetical protein